jgi:hypothetical protein
MVNAMGALWLRHSPESTFAKRNAFFAVEMESNQRARACFLQLPNHLMDLHTYGYSRKFTVDSTPHHTISSPRGNPLTLKNNHRICSPLLHMQ